MNKASKHFYKLIDQISDLLLLPKHDLHHYISYGYKDMDQIYLLTPQQIFHTIQRQINYGIKCINNKATKAVFDSDSHYQEYVSSEHFFIKGLQDALSQAQEQLSSSDKSIYVYFGPNNYRSLNEKDLPQIDKLFNSFIGRFQDQNIKGYAYLLLKSKYSSYEINRRSGVSLSIITELREHKKSINKLNINTVLKLAKFYVKTPTYKYWCHYQVKFAE